MIYYYRILTERGKVMSGFQEYEGVDLDAVAAAIERAREGVLVRLFQLPWLLGIPVRLLLRAYQLGLQRWKKKCLPAFLKDLAAFLQAGLPAQDALRAMKTEGDESGDARASMLAGGVLLDLEMGLSISEALRRHESVFPASVINMVAIGERTGDLDRMLEQSAAYLERIGDIGRKLRAALVYPAFVCLAMVGVLAFWMMYVVPALESVFIELGSELPEPTRRLMEFSDFLVSRPLELLAGALVPVAAVVSAWRYSRTFRKVVYGTLYRVPIGRNILVAASMSRVCDFQAMIIRAGMDFLAGLRLVAENIPDPCMRDAMEELARLVERGEALAPAMRQIRLIPSNAVRVVSVGEQTGTLERQLQSLAVQYARRLDNAVDQLTEAVRPAVMIIVGVLFVALVYSLLMPVYRTMGSAVML